MLRGQRSGVRGELFITTTSTTTTIINTTVIVITVFIKVTKADLNSIIMDPDDAPCYCDHNCLNMGDCCPDFKDYCGGIFALTLAFINEIMMMVMMMMMMLTSMDAKFDDFAMRDGWTERRTDGATDGRSDGRTDGRCAFVHNTRILISYDNPEKTVDQNCA